MATGPGRRVRFGRALRRLALACLLVGAAVATPTIAWATFTSTTSGTVSAGTATLAAPSSVTLAVACPRGNGMGNGNAGSVTVTFPGASRATSYDVLLVPPAGPSATTNTTSGATGATFSLNRTVGSYTVSVTSLVQGWTSASVVQTFAC